MEVRAAITLEEFRSQQESNLAQLIYYIKHRWVARLTEIM
jgi:hypothetical protein